MKSNFIGKYGSSQDIDRLISDGDPDGIRSAMHKNQAWTKEHTDAAAKSEHPSIRMTMARHRWRKLSDDQRNTLMKDPVPEIAHQAKISYFSHMHGDDLANFIKDPENKIYHVMAYEAGINNNKFGDHHIKRFMDHSDVRIRRHAHREMDDRWGVEHE